MSKKLRYLDFALAQEKSLEIVTPIKATQMLNISDAQGKILACDITCKKNLPAFDNSAMDGFACRFEDAGKSLHVQKVIYAGDKNLSPSLKENECYKIMTGAFVPSDADTIVPIEKCLHVSDESVCIPKDVKKGDNLRLKGEEQKKGDLLLKKGDLLDFSAISLLATQGIVMVEVYKPLSIAVLSTGNELKEPWENSDDEEIYNCNSYALISLLKANGFEADYCGVVPDDLEQSVDFIKNLKNYDVVLTSGGISFGDADFMYEAFLQNGLEVAFHGVNIKPGRPIMMGKMDKTLVICLPGNPLTAMVNMSLLGIPVLSKMQGSAYFYGDCFLAQNTETFYTKKGRVNVVLGKLENGNFTATKNNKYGSGMISLLAYSNALLVTNEQTSVLEKGERVFVLDFNGRFLDKQINIFN